MSSSVIRCAACTKRIKPHHPHIGVVDLEAGGEISYHARCQERAALETAARIERGKVYVLRHYHSSTCPDERPGFGCAGGCFDTVAAAVN
ncbi:MAG: hypothetical protein M3R38_12765 [Actinomycetota bacterium]|nr:hypothetical protein [Actinomycetota bacterium]